jgi:hypothetical protein
LIHSSRGGGFEARNRRRPNLARFRLPGDSHEIEPSDRQDTVFLGYEFRPRYAFRSITTTQLSHLLGTPFSAKARKTAFRATSDSESSTISCRVDTGPPLPPSNVTVVIHVIETP